MIKVDLTKENEIVIKGHANYDEIGKDIVCASVSSIVITTINIIIELDDKAIEYEDLDNKIVIKKLKEDDIINKILNNMIFMLEGLEKDYPKNIKILRR